MDTTFGDESSINHLNYTFLFKNVDVFILGYCSQSFFTFSNKNNFLALYVDMKFCLDQVKEPKRCTTNPHASV